MVKKYVLILIIGLFVINRLDAQTIASPNPSKKNVVLEEYTGVRCQYCPEGHAIAENLLATNPRRVVLVNVHQGSFANPNPSYPTHPNFTTIFGDALANQSGVNSYPSGTVNRHIFPPNTSTVLNRGSWTPAASIIMDENSPVNIGLQSQYDSLTRILTVTVELYYTANSPTTTNNLNVAFLENHVIGFQQTTSGGVNNYDHKHILRHFITGQWGDVISTTTQGTLVTKTYTYTVPANFVTKNCDVAAYVATGHQEILTGDVVKAIGGTNLYIGQIETITDVIVDGTPYFASGFSMNLRSALQGSQNFTIEVTNNAPANWTNSLIISGTTYTGIATVSLIKDNNVPMTINVTPGTTAGIATYTIKMKSVNNPTAPEIIRTLTVISGVEDLIVNNQGSWSNGSPATLAPDFEAGLTFANNTSYSQVSYPLFIKGKQMNKFSNVENIYFNVGWTAPTLTDENIAIFKTFLNQGGNLFISGQDVGWDTFDTLGNGTDSTKSFYNNYLKAIYVADGSGANNSISANTSDMLFGTFPTSALRNIYGTNNMFPDELSSVNGGTVVLYYKNLPSKGAAVRYSNSTYKTVYFGFDPSSITNVANRNQAIKIVNDWFKNIIDDLEFDNSMKTLLNQNYPNPASDFTFIPIQNSKNSKLQVTDITGKVIEEINLENNISQYRLDTRNYQNGTYFYRLINNNSVSNTKMLQIVK